MITAGNRKLLVLALMLIGNACSGGTGNFGSANDNKNEESDEEEEEEEEEEEADPPEVVTGAYLTCVDTNDAAQNEVSYGCSLSKSNGKPINLPDVATQWKWHAVPPKNSDHKVKVIDRSESGDKAIYLFSGGEKTDLKKYAEETQVALSLNLKTDVAGYKPFRSTIKDASSQDALGQNSSSSSSSSTTNTKLQIPSASPASGTVTSGPEPVKLPELPVSIPDRDKDGVADANDLCNDTKPGSTVWKDGEWAGCSGGEYKDTDDLDRDKVSNIVDICPSTPLGMAVDFDPASPTYGCALSEVY